MGGKGGLSTIHRADSLSRIDEMQQIMFVDGTAFQRAD
jgi:hypothetical protein